MPRKFYNTQCCHCLKQFEVLTSDHVFPISWYPKTTPPDLEKWQVPACNDCNKKYGKLEEELMLKIGLCLDPFSKEAFGIPQKMLKALDPTRGKNEKDTRIRERKKKQIINQMVDPSAIPLSAIIPEFGFHEGRDIKTEKGILISADKISAIGEKIIRGTTWVLDQLYIDERYKILVRYFHEIEAREHYEILNIHGKEYNLGPGLKVTRAITEENPLCGIYYILIWGQVKIHGLVNLKHNIAQPSAAPNPQTERVR